MVKSRHKTHVTSTASLKFNKIPEKIKNSDSNKRIKIKVLQM